jgi:hypothetical protein
MKRLALALICLPAVAAAQDFSGVYQMVDCSEINRDMRMTVSGNSLEFHESACQMSNPVAVQGGATQVDLTCGGEGETWTTRAVIMRSEQGLTMIRDGYTFAYLRCG